MAMFSVLKIVGLVLIERYNMEDLTNYSDDELSLRVFNDEFMYKHRDDIEYLKEVIFDNFFKYTDAQMEVLIQDIADDAEEL